jgi:hypothetical protein
MSTFSHLLKRIWKREEQESLQVLDTITKNTKNIYHKFHDRIYCHGRLFGSFYGTDTFVQEDEIWDHGLSSILNERTMDYIRRNRGLRGTYIKDYAIFIKLGIYLDDIINNLSLCIT